MNFSPTDLKMYIFLTFKEGYMAKLPNYFISGKLFQKRPTGNRGPRHIY